MILYQADWYDQGAVPHYDTNNPSFARLAIVMRQMGIKNSDFFMALHNKELAPYDPHNLTDSSFELRQLIGIECAINPWYFFREVVRLPASGGDGIPIRANRALIAMIWCFYNHITYIAIQPRQTGKTIGACAIATHVLYVAGFNIEITLYTKDAKLVHANVARVKNIRDSLPRYLIHKQTSDMDNKEGLSYSKLKNYYLTAIAPGDKNSADNLGRGMTSPIIHLDEPAFCDNIDITYPVMMFSTITAVKNARARGQPHSNLLTTTAAPIDTARGKFAFDLVNRAMPFTEKLYDQQNNEETKALVRANSSNDMVNGTFSYLMLGLSHKWYEDACRTSEASQDVNDRELLNQWKSGSETSILDPETIRILNANRHEPHFVEIIKNYAIKWYIPEDRVGTPAFFSRRYILGMDCSENIGQDFTTCVLIDVADMSVACTFRCNESNTIKIGLFIADFLIKYPNVTFIPERNSTGTAIIDTVTITLQRAHINAFRRIFNQIVQKRNEPAMAQINIDDTDIIDTTAKRHLGFHTTARTRPFLYKNTLKKAASMNATRIYDGTLVSELSTLAVVNGRIDHKEGNHDDMVIAYLLACWLVFFGENLRYYGIESKTLLTDVALDGSIVDPQKRDEQFAIRRQIKIYDDLIARASSPIVQNNYRQKIALLQSKIDPNFTIEPIGVTKLSHDVKEFGSSLHTSASETAPPKLNRVSADYAANRIRSLIY